MKFPAGRGALIGTASAFVVVAVFLGFALSGAIASSGATRSQAVAALSDDVLTTPGQGLSLTEKDARNVAWAVVDGVRHGDITVASGRLLVAQLRPLLGSANPGTLRVQRGQFDRFAETFFEDIVAQRIVASSRVVAIRTALGALAVSLGTKVPPLARRAPHRPTTVTSEVGRTTTTARLTPKHKRKGTAPAAKSGGTREAAPPTTQAPMTTSTSIGSGRSTTVHVPPTAHVRHKLRGSSGRRHGARKLVIAAPKEGPPRTTTTMTTDRKKSERRIPVRTTTTRPAPARGNLRPDDHYAASLGTPQLERAHNDASDLDKANQRG